MIKRPSGTQRKILDFLEVQYARERERAELHGGLLVNVGAPQLGLTPEQAEREARIETARADLLQRFVDETIRPHLTASGPLGQNADRQLRLLAWGYSNQPDYRDDWQPTRT